MAPRPTSDELWGHHLMPSTLFVDVLLPNGLMLSIPCTRETTLDTIKERIFDEAKKEVLFRLLNDMSTYIFVAITQDAKADEFYNETRRLCDLKLFLPVLKLTEPKGNKEEKLVNYDISLAIGKNLTEFDNMKDPEIVDFRRNILNLCKDTVELRESLPMEKKVEYFFPPEYDECEQMANSIECDIITVNVVIDERHTLTLNISQEVKPVSAIKDIIVKTMDMGIRLLTVDAEAYVLKVNGMEQYLLGSQKMSRYRYIRHCLSRRKCPHLILRSKYDLYRALPTSSFLIPSFIRRTTPQSVTEDTATLIQSGQFKSLYQVHTNFRLNILLATYVNVRDVDKIYVKTGIYNGSNLLHETKDTRLVEPGNPQWYQWIEYKLYIPDLPRSACLCMSICSVSYRKRREEHCALAWGNIRLFDYRSRLLRDRVSVYMFPVPKGFDDLLNPLGRTGFNVNKDSPCLEIEFDKLSPPVIYPLMSEIMYYVRHCNEKVILETRSPTEPTQADVDQLSEIIKRDPLADMSLQEKELLWKMRNKCKELQYRDSLPKLLDAVNWAERDYVSVIYDLLEKWPPVKPETALELLYQKYADIVVRQKAVAWLEQGWENKDDLVCQYLLQLVQVVKNEPYLDNPLARFLLKKALLNRKIGFMFFWYLKAEMHDPSCCLRCGLMLEAYCRGIGTEMLKITIKQVEALDKLTKLTDELREKKDDTQKDRLEFMRSQIKNSDYMAALEHFPSPLNNSVILGDIQVPECRIMDSAKRPLWLVWTNPDEFVEDVNRTIAVIFKNGDDLRQDMLTLQVIKIMDSIWRSEGLDMKMLPYTCLATGKQVGMIDVVRGAKTVMGIQRSGGRMAAFQVDSKQLHRWIKEKNKSNYAEAVKTFTKSCAGYCVATFVLGIGDRNPDNIMVNEEGQIFHIDFGHFLGHFKKKFGINRERVPFVLTDDFMAVITKGAENPQKSTEFDEFIALCGSAYVSLRRHSSLLITLFTMMLSTGIPELQSMDDIGYLRKTLQVEKTEKESLEYFHRQITDAYKGAWTTKFDWFFHSVKHISSYN